MNKRVLLYGNNSQVLHVRAMVFEHSGFPVVRVARLDQIARQPAGTEISLLVLCHTLSLAEKQSAIRKTREQWPGVTLISLVTGDCVHAHGDECLSIFRGPQALVDRSRQLTA